MSAKANEMTIDNHYPSLVAAAKSLAGTEILDRGDVPVDDAARAFLQRNQSTFAAVREALAKPCKVPLRFDETFYEEHLAELQDFRCLARSLALEFDALTADGQLVRAVSVGIDLLYLANAVRRGGLVTDLLIGICLSGIGLDRLRRLRSTVVAETRRFLVAELARFEGEREPFDDVVQRDRKWEAIVETDSLTDSVIDMKAELKDDNEGAILEALEEIAKLPDDTLKHFYRTQDQWNSALLRMLSVDLQIRSWHAEQGRYPPALDSLVVDSGESAIVDPWSQQPFCYRPLSDDFLLYSTGPAQIDHGGQIGAWPDVTCGQADLGLDSFDMCPTLFCQVAGRQESWGGTLKGWASGLWTRLASS